MPRRSRRRAWGSIDSVIPNKKYVLRWMENTPEGRRRRCETFYGTYREADLRLAQIRVERAADKPVPTIGEAYKTWYLPELERRVSDGEASKNTLSQYAHIWKKVIEPRWSRVPVDSTRALDIQEWLLTLSRGNANQAIRILRKIMDVCVRYELAESNKFREVFDMPKKQSRERSRDVYTLREAADVFRALHGKATEAAFILSCFGSCRTGESLGVKVAELERRETDGLVFALAPITRQMERTGDFPTGTLKTKSSKRTIIVPPPYSLRLMEIADERRAEGIEWTTHRGDGLPMTTRQLRHEWNTENEKSIPFANCRNSWRTFAEFEWNVDAATLELLMGHKLPGVSGSHYLRPTIDQLYETFSSQYAEYFFGLRQS